MDEDGFYRVECNLQSGLVPSNMVKELLGGKGERSERKQRRNRLPLQRAWRPQRA